MASFKVDDKIVVWNKPKHYKGNSGLFGSIKEVLTYPDGYTLYSVVTENNQKFLVTNKFLTFDN